MLVNLKITTIGKIISMTLVFCLMVIAVGNMEFISAQASGEAASLFFEPVDDVAGNNQVKVMLNTDGAMVNGVTVKFDNIPTGDTDPNYFNCENDIDLADPNCSLPDHAVLNDVRMGDNTVTLITLGKGINDSAVHLFTLDLAEDGLAHTLTIEAVGSMISTPDGEAYDIGGSDVSYTILENEDPEVAVDIVQNQIGVPVNKNIELTISDNTDSEVNIESITLIPTGGSNVFEEKYGAWAGSTVDVGTLTLTNKEYLDYSTEYELTVTVKDDQGGVGTTTKTFTTELDVVRPPAPSNLMMNKYQWSDTLTNVVGEFSFYAEADDAPGLIDKAYLFMLQDFESAGGNMLMGVNGFSYDNYENNAKAALVSLVADGKVVTEVALDKASGDFSANFKGESFGDDLPPFIAKDIFQNQPFFLVIKDSSGNFSNPAHLVKKGDYISGDYSPYPDGSLTTADAIYSYRHSEVPENCPLPPTLNTNVAVDCQ